MRGVARTATAPGSQATPRYPPHSNPAARREGSRVDCRMWEDFPGGDSRLSSFTAALPAHTPSHRDVRNSVTGSRALRSAAAPGVYGSLKSRAKGKFFLLKGRKHSSGWRCGSSCCCRWSVTCRFPRFLFPGGQSNLASVLRNGKRGCAGRCPSFDAPKPRHPRFGGSDRSELLGKNTWPAMAMGACGVPPPVPDHQRHFRRLDSILGNPLTFPLDKQGELR